MKITQLMTPMTEIQWLAVTDTVRDAFDHMETYDLHAVPVLDGHRRYVGTVTEADLRRHLDGAADRPAALATPLSDVERRSRNIAVTPDRELASVADHAAGHRFIPVVDDHGQLVGIVDRQRILASRLPAAA